MLLDLSRSKTSSPVNEDTNLIDLTPEAFEHLITNLFNAMEFEPSYTSEVREFAGRIGLLN